MDRLERMEAQTDELRRHVDATTGPGYHGIVVTSNRGSPRRRDNSDEPRGAKLHPLARRPTSTGQSRRGIAGIGQIDSASGRTTQSNQSTHGRGIDRQNAPTAV